MPFDPKVFLEQSVHLEPDVSPRASVVVPASQSEHSDEAGASLNVPSSQATQTSLALAATDLLAFPASHREHGIVPLVDLYWPAMQALHDPIRLVVPLKDPAKPSRQTQSSPPSEPAGE